jgi:uncharacterized protein involved in cysteine biosynthesis
VFRFAFPVVIEYGNKISESIPKIIVSGLVSFALTISFLLLYTFIFVPLLNAILSPFLDIIAVRAYEDTSGRKLPQLGASDFFRSFVSECSKTILILLAVAFGVLLPSVIPGGALLYIFFAPAGLLLSIWFFGWDHVDRTLSLMGLSLRQRLMFGVRHATGCFCLGLWMYVPFAGTFLSFTFSAAGAILVAHIHGHKQVPTNPAS